MGKLNIRKIEPNRWAIWVVPEDGYEGFSDSFCRKRFRRYGWYYCNDHNGVMFSKRQDAIQYLLKNF